MRLAVKEMALSEVDLIIDYFHGATPEHLEMLGVDPTRLPDPVKWRERYSSEYELAIEKRKTLLVLWLADDRPIGFSTADKIKYGEQAHMHLHVVDPELRNSGVGAECVRQTVAFYFEALKLKRIFCEPNAFNTAPNRALQRAGFRYVKTHRTVPNALNYHQAVTRWVKEK